MIVRQEHCTTPKCKGCGKHLGHEHEEYCLIAVAEAFRKKSGR
jgi:hypothetical protein